MSDTLISRGSLRGERVIRRQWHVAARMKHVNKLVRNRRGQEGNSHHIRQDKKKMVEKTNQKLEHNYESAQKRFKNIKNKKRNYW